MKDKITLKKQRGEHKNAKSKANRANRQAIRRARAEAIARGEKVEGRPPKGSFGWYRPGRTVRNARKAA